MFGKHRSRARGPALRGVFRNRGKLRGTAWNLRYGRDNEEQLSKNAGEHDDERDQTLFRATGGRGNEKGREKTVLG